MAEVDWTVVAGSLTTGDTDRGVTNAQGNPNGGASFIHGFSSLTGVVGAVGLFANQAGSNPMAKGARVSGAMKRLPGAAETGWSAFLFAALQDDAIDSDCYMLGLADSNPAKLVLRKGALDGGLQSQVIGQDGVLAISDASFAEDTWIHVRMDVVVNLNNDVIITVSANDLVSNQVDEPEWAGVAGMSPVLDDAFGQLLGSRGLVGGRAGFGFEQRGSNRTSFLDHIEVARQV